MVAYIARKDRINQVGNRTVLESNKDSLFDILSKYDVASQDDLLDMDDQELVNYVLSLPEKDIKQAIVTECYLALVDDWESER
mgnify:CR=1 FL=1|tara:strand:+ start:769 stop:1017 length:249 start_codon:yes stop_codon:yes gene_type:complete